MFGTWFRELSKGEPRVGGAAAAGFLKKSNLPQIALKQVWDICDSGRLGSIDQASVHACSPHAHAKMVGLSSSACVLPRLRRNERGAS